MLKWADTQQDTSEADTYFRPVAEPQRRADIRKPRQLKISSPADIRPFQRLTGSKIYGGRYGPDGGGRADLAGPGRHL